MNTELQPLLFFNEIFEQHKTSSDVEIEYSLLYHCRQLVERLTGRSRKRVVFQLCKKAIQYEHNILLDYLLQYVTTSELDILTTEYVNDL